MARQTIVKLIDDLDGGEAAETLTFGLDGTEYTIDLSEKNAGKLRKVIAPYAEAGVVNRTANGRRDSRSAPGRLPARPDKEQQAFIRRWCRANGWPDLSDRGRIPGEALAAYNAAHGVKTRRA